MDIKGAIFDMDGTLVDSLSGWKVIWQKISERFLDGRAFLPEAEVDKKIRTMLLTDAFRYIHEVYHIGETAEELLTFTNGVLRDYYANVVPLKPGVLTFLSHLYDRGVPMCIASATDRPLIELAVAHCGIGTYISGIISCADVGKGKEVPDVFEKAREVLGTPKEQTYVFEDSYTALKTAHDAGFKTVGVYDALSYFQDKIEKTADYYIGAGETMEKLIK